MSIPVAIDRLAETLADFDAGYLLTTADARVKAVSVVPTYADGVLRIATPGRGSVANVGANAVVTLLYPPREAPGFSLLVDGTAVVDGDNVVVTPGSAILHKPAVGA
ncbi:pyridoxamine 5'-phosphate oxidase [Nocardioides sp.]|uniref:pyridoxamine 5'-phosphate oxidase n=1 Tax=Nocardioides sp. TaxID=35761 RepID=UPI00272082B8|nr:pyridoxamine 5'-phosphate oxidase [Nocardioides sp.]MDO9458365.1 pyridoxamine 5'-phosphate oxidase [Nocardioides sp.]